MIIVITVSLICCCCCYCCCGRGVVLFVYQWTWHIYYTNHYISLGSDWKTFTTLLLACKEQWGIYLICERTMSSSFSIWPSVKYYVKNNNLIYKLWSKYFYSWQFHSLMGHFYRTYPYHHLSGPVIHSLLRMCCTHLSTPRVMNDVKIIIDFSCKIKSPAATSIFLQRASIYTCIPIHIKVWNAS